MLGFPLQFAPSLEPREIRPVEVGGETRDILRELGWSDQRIKDVVDSGSGELTSDGS